MLFRVLNSVLWPKRQIPLRNIGSIISNNLSQAFVMGTLRLRMEMVAIFVVPFSLSYPKNLAGIMGLSRSLQKEIQANGVLLGFTGLQAVQYLHLLETIGCFQINQGILRHNTSHENRSKILVCIFPDPWAYVNVTNLCACEISIFIPL